MKKQHLNYLKLNKKSISALNNERIKGGTNFQHPSNGKTECNTCLTCPGETC